MPLYIPTQDGEVHEFVSAEAAASGYFDTGRSIVFVNGMMNSGKHHAESAEALSLMQMCPVVGVFNRTDGFWTDLGQCIADKYQFDGPLARDPRSALDKAVEQQKKKGRSAVTRESVVRDVLARNPASVSLFNLLRERPRVHVFAHSQGNLVASNTVSALKALGGTSAISGIVVHSYGSPAVNWPTGLSRFDHAFTWDPVTFLAGVDWSFKISKVGVPSGAYNPISHGFDQYMKNDPAFIVNRFRWGSFGVTFSMDEDGLAACLADMGRNLPRVAAIFEHLHAAHNSDVDDIALRYVQSLQRRPGGPEILAQVRNTPGLRDLLIRSMEKGWTSAAEKEAIAALNAR